MPQSIVVVDDEVIIREPHPRIIEKGNFEVSEARNEREAFE
jgi:DNA-binding NtrC family response regulator